MFKKRAINDHKILVLVRLLDASKKFLIFLALFGQVWSLVPWSSFHTNAITVEPQETTTYSFQDYPTTTDPNFDASKVEVDTEVISKRTESSKTFRKIDGTYEVAMYNTPIHYQNEGEWKQIDNSLNDLGDELENKDNKFKVKFPKLIDDNKSIKLTLDKYRMDWNILDINTSSIRYDTSTIEPNNIRELIHVNQPIMYQQILQDVDIEYILTGNRIKENIILNQYIENFDLTFEYKLNDMSMIQDENESILFLNEEDEIVFSFDELYMIDDELNESSDVAYELTYLGNKVYQITIIPSDDWLETAVYPVKIDPSLVINGSDNPGIRDKYVTPSAVYEARSYLMVGKNSTTTYKSYIEISTAEIPEDAIVSYAHLQLRTYYGTAYNHCDYLSCQINLKKVNYTSSWASITRTTFSDVNAFIEDYDYVYPEDEGIEYYRWDMTKAMNDWIVDNRSVGIVELSKQDLVTNDHMYFSSEEYGATIGPNVLIGYQYTTGLYNFWTYHSAPVGDAGTVMINDFTGELNLVRNDYYGKHEGLVIDLGMYYSENLKNTNIGYGLGWRTNFDSFATINDTTGERIVTNASGSKTYFEYVPAEFATDEPLIRNNNLITYLADDGSRNILVVHDYDNDQDLDTIVYTPDRMRSIYVDDMLVRIENLKTEQFLDIHHDANDRIDKITDFYGNYVSFEYNSTTGNLEYQLVQLCQAWDTNGECNQTNLVEVIEFDYAPNALNNNYNLSSVIYHKDYRGTVSYLDIVNSTYLGFSTFMTNASTDIAIYEYFDTLGGDDRLDSITSSDGLNVVIQYDALNKVDQYIYTMDGSNLGFIDIEYALYQTTFEDHMGNSVMYTFDSYGHTVNILDDFGNAIYYRYLNPWVGTFETKNLFVNHKLVESSLPQKTQLNPIGNHSFEYNTPSTDVNWNFVIDATAGFPKNPTGSYLTTNCLFGDKAASIFVYPDQIAHLEQQIILDQGNDYRFGGYIYGDTSEDAYLAVTVGGTTYYSLTNSQLGEWEYLYVDFDIASNNTTVTVKLFNSVNGRAYFDNIQITDAFQDTRVNILDNPSFEMNTTGWTLSNATRVYDGVENQQGDLYDSILGDYYIQVIGDADLGKYIETTLTSSDFVAGSNYIIAAWAKGDVTPNKHYDENPDGRAFGIYVTLSDGTNSDVFYFEFDSDIESWQYQASKIYVDNTITSINVKVYYRGEGAVYFDGIQMYNEAFGTKYAYDAYGNKEYVSTPESSGIIQYTYDANNRFLLDSITDQNNKVTRYDAFSSGLFKDVTQNNIATSVVRDNNNQISSISVGEDANNDGVIDGSYYQNLISYTTKGQFIGQTEDEFGSQVDYSINLLNGLLSSFDNAIDEETSYTYDQKGRVTRITKDSTVINYKYMDDLLIEIEFNDTVYKLYYDDLNRIEYVYIGTGSEQNFSGTMLKEFIFGSDVIDDITYESNRISEEIFGNGDQIKLTYNEENQIEGLWFYETNQYVQRYAYEYNQSGNLTVLKDIRDGQEYYYNYDLVGRIKKVTNSDGEVTSYQYDNAGNLHIYTFDIAGYERSINYNYDLSSGMYDSTTYDNVTKNYNFDTDDLRRLISISLATTSTTLNTISYTYFEGNDVTNGNISTRVKTILQTNAYHYFTQTLEYDAQGFIKKITNQSSSIVEYFYDAKDQLIRENNQIDGYTYTYSYNGYGNLITQHFYAFVAGDSNLSTLEKSEYYYYDSIWKDQIYYICVDHPTDPQLDYTLTYSFDDSGNVVSMDDSRGTANDRSFEWEGRSLVSQTIGSDSYSYTYNQHGIRDSKTINSTTTTYYLDGALVLYETDGTNQIYYTYDVDGSLISMRYNGTEYFYMFDVFGNVSYLIDSSGYIVVEYRYDSYGNITYQTSSALADANPYRYRSYRYDQESGLYYLQSRYYNPETGRFINADGMLKASNTVLGHNMFAYTENNPVMNTDANGYCAFASQSDPETFLDIKNCSGSDYTGRIKLFFGLYETDYFNSINEAVINWGHRNGKLTSLDHMERGAIILSRVIYGRTRYYVSVTFTGDNDDNVIGFIIGYSLTFYSSNVVGFIHSHTAYPHSDGTWNKNDYGPSDADLFLFNLPGIKRQFIVNELNQLYEFDKEGDITYVYK